MLYMKVVKRVNPEFSSQEKNFFNLFNFVSIWDDGYSLKDNHDNHFMMYVSQIIMLYTLSLFSAVWQLYFNKTGRRKKEKKKSMERL